MALLSQPKKKFEKLTVNVIGHLFFSVLEIYYMRPKDILTVRLSLVKNKFLCNMTFLNTGCRKNIFSRIS